MKIVPYTTLLALLATIVGFSVQAQGPEGTTNLKGPSEAAKAVEDYWTEERMKAAKPLDLPTLAPEQHRKLLQIPLGPEAKEPPKVAEPGDGTAKGGAPSDPSPKGAPAKANVRERPFWNGGKWFFTKASGGDYVCSAEFVGSKRVVMTAAHCVMDGATGQWHKNFKFVRAYDNGGGQSVGWDCMSVKTAWHTSGPNYPYDYAFVYASSDSGAGWLGLMTDIPYSQFWAIGYPGNYDNGKYMYKVEGTKGTVSGGTVAMNGNPFGGGSSGGAWIGDLTTPVAAGNYAIGLNSYYVGHTDPMYSPYFDNVTFGLYEYVRDKKCTQ